MAFDIFPDAATASLLGKPAFAPLRLSQGEAMRVFVPLPQRIGPDPSRSDVPTTFVRIAQSGQSLEQIPPPMIDLSAADPAVDPTLAHRIDAAVSTSIGSAVALFDGVNPTSAALAYFEPEVVGNVRLLKIAREIPDTQLWMRIANEAVDPFIFYVWAVADSDEDSQQPWLSLRQEGDDRLPLQLAFDSYVGQAFALNAKRIAVRNFGTGPATAVDCDPPLSAPFALQGLPLRLSATGASVGTISVGLDAPVAAGDFAPAPLRLVTRDKPDPGPFGEDRNNPVTLTAHVAIDNNWAFGPSLRVARKLCGAAASADGAICVFGGSDPASTESLKSVEIFHENAGRWEAAPDMPTGRRSLAAALGRDGLIYAIGGVSAGANQLSGANEAFDPRSGAWRSLKPMPTPRQGLAVTAGGDGLIYAIGGGTNSETPLDVVEVYDPVADSWSSRHPLPSPREYLAAATSDDGVVYVAGGFVLPTSLTSAIPDLIAFDPQANAWATKKPMSVGRAGLAFAAGRNGKLYAVGGGDIVHRGSQLTEEYDPLANAWRVLSPTNAPRFFGRLAASASGRLYLVSGAPDAGSVEVFAP